MSFRDRFYTPQVAGAMMDPKGILSGGAGAAAGVLVTIPLGPIGAVLGAVLGGMLAWAARVRVAMPKAKKGSTTRIDAFALNEPWKRLVRDAQQADQNFERALHGTPKGPLLDRLGEIRRHIDEGVVEVWEIAKAGNAVGIGRSQLNRPAVDAELAETRRMRAAHDSPSLVATEEALLVQLATADRMDATLRESESRLRLLNARLDEAVTRAIELSVSQADSTAAGALRADVAGIVDEMEALRQAMVEVRAVDATVPKPLPDFTTQPDLTTQPPQTQPPQTQPPQGDVGETGQSEGGR